MGVLQAVFAPPCQHEVSLGYFRVTPDRDTFRGKSLCGVGTPPFIAIERLGALLTMDRVTLGCGRPIVKGVVVHSNHKFQERTLERVLKYQNSTYNFFYFHLLHKRIHNRLISAS